MPLKIKKSQPVMCTRRMARDWLIENPETDASGAALAGLSVMKRVQYAETVIDIGSPVSMTGQKANLLPLKPNRNAAPGLLHLPLPRR
ncbi:hypothetical protein IFM58399_08249 [Aspergillus lentulus]|uniref:uncharacterized protein n=1 Tax=Aspergillus lentulus TaxID=293939 RepID=UPI001395A21B|nr:uncharacterized protein IFM58399_08249 [Aspergillus lentulus]KAF4161501.1 hypothetical protein CNMCM6069_003407 [Aspergillus lentulus]GFF48236.1 hypothetical protein IFM58399_08249 [Aspergillus lentulus]GFF72772.1 hypothetical protein IFM62136_08409 [Aspergillus lentulus]GFG14401.1 hypothetical protein IFM61392_08435 [Aspergillus lentulus]